MAHRLAVRARTDLDEIWTYLFAQSGSEPIADGQIDLITSRFHLLATWPRLGRSRPELRRGLRSHQVGSWVIFYRIQRGEVVILRVLHGRRNLGPIFGQG